MQKGMSQQQFSLFGDSDEVVPTKKRAGALFDSTKLTSPPPPKRGPQTRRFGTSSWTYPGWQGSVYKDADSYGSAQRFTELCLAEYARDSRFRCAGADNMYYVPPAARLKLLGRYRGMLGSLLEPLELLPKVWHEITVNRYSPLQQQEWRLSSDVNPHFLDADRFLDKVAQPLAEGLGIHLGPLILEIQENDIHSVEFLRLLDEFLETVRSRWNGRIAVELRSPSHFEPRYLDILHAHGYGHVLSSWTRMPSIGWQYEQVQARHGLRWPFFVVRALLRPGVRYDDASAYAPYNRIITRAPEVRADILRVLREVAQDTPCYVLVNNHLEGHSPGTIAELQTELGI